MLRFGGVEDADWLGGKKATLRTAENGLSACRRWRPLAAALTTSPDYSRVSALHPHGLTLKPVLNLLMIWKLGGMHIERSCTYSMCAHAV
jgi:hypothetical protein